MTAPAYVRGVGAISALGADWPTTASALAAGRSGVREFSARDGIDGYAGFDAADYPCRVGAPIAVDGDGRWEDRRIAMTRRAVREAWSMAAIDPDLSVGVFVGAESGLGRFVWSWLLTRAAGGGTTFDPAAFATNAPALVHASDGPRLETAQIAPSGVSAAIADMLADQFDPAGGPTETISLACASGTAAIAEAVRALARGECDAAICGGVGAMVDPLVMAGFGRLGALSTSGAPRPFDVQRDGFVLGEGAAFLVLSREPGAAADAAITGVGISLDAHHLTAPDPSGAGARRAMHAALADAGVDRVQYVQAHGTATPRGDAVEASAIRSVLGDRLSDAHVGSVKGALGHWIAGAGALGALCAWHAVTTGEMIPTVGLTDLDAECALPHVVDAGQSAQVHAALVNSFAFGGANCCLVVTRCG